MASRACCSSKACCGGSPKGKGPNGPDVKQDHLDLDATQIEAARAPPSKSSTQTTIIIGESNRRDGIATSLSIPNIHQHHSSVASLPSPDADARLVTLDSCSDSPLECCSLPAAPKSSCNQPLSPGPVAMLCCGLPHHHHREESDSYAPPEADDIDRDNSTFQRYTLTVQGLKCGCCENGISKAVGHISAIKNHQVNVVLARVEFDLNVDQYSVGDIIKKLNGATGYTFEEYVPPDGQVLELMVEDPSELRRAGRPYGVTLLESDDKRAWTPSRIFSGRSSTVPEEVIAEPPAKQMRVNEEAMDPPEEKTVASRLFQRTMRVHYDAKKIGARDILEYYETFASGQSVTLAPPAAHPSLAIGAKQTQRACLIFLISLLFTLPVIVFAWAPIVHEKLVYAHASLAFASVVQLIASYEFIPGAARSLIHSGLFEMDFLIALSTTTAYIFSVVSYGFQLKKRPLETGSFFETSTLLVTLILLGRVVSEAARYRAAKSVSFRSLQAEDALLIVSGGSPSAPQTRKIDARLLQYGDSFKVPPHTRIVTDGKVKSGGSEVDESMITGESLPVAKGHDSPVYAGTNNGSGTLIVALTALPHENSVSRIATMVENAELTKPRAQALADRIAGWFVPAMAAIGTVVFLVWLLMDRFHHHRSWQQAVVKALTYAIATLIVSCPCAIGLAVPMVILIAGGVAARCSIIFRDPQKLEIARNVTDVVFDKTGTLTTGRLTVVKADFLDGEITEVKLILLGLLNGIRHPVSAAVFDWLKNQGQEPGITYVRPLEMSSVSSIPGEGVEGTCKRSGVQVRAGNPEWQGVEVLESEHTLFCVTIAGKHRATFRLKDRVRNTASATVKRLQDQGIRVHMISGDNAGTATAVAFALNIPKLNVESRFKPEDKQKYIQGLQEERRVVMFVGDGTNDAVALKQADVGVHMNNGSDVAKSAADVVLMNPRLHDILVLLDISRAAYRRIVLNFAWSALYNLVAILMAAGAFVKVRIAPAYAGLGELVSVLPVVFIAFQMKWRGYGKEYRRREWDSLEETTAFN